MTPTNVIELREQLENLLSKMPVIFGGETLSPELSSEAMKEIGDAIMMNVLNGSKPTACQSIVARFFISLLERDAG